MKSTMRCTLLALVLLITTQPGCMLLHIFMPRKPTSDLDLSILKAQGYSIPPGGMPSPVQFDPSDGPRVVMEIRGDKRHMESIPLPENGMFVQDLVQQAKLNKAFGALQISILRPTNSGAAPVRLDLQTDEDGKVTNISQNYALHPGDHVIVLHDDRTYLERFVDKAIKKK
jgi:hypothetical protein